MGVEGLSISLGLEGSPGGLNTAFTQLTGAMHVWGRSQVNDYFLLKLTWIGAPELATH